VQRCLYARIEGDGLQLVYGFKLVIQLLARLL
jgi:hypothetical protein